MSHATLQNKGRWGGGGFAVAGHRACINPLVVSSIFFPKGRNSAEFDAYFTSIQAMGLFLAVKISFGDTASLLIAFAMSSRSMLLCPVFYRQRAIFP